MDEKEINNIEDINEEALAMLTENRGEDDE